MRFKRSLKPLTKVQVWHKYKYYILSGLAFIAIGVLETMKPKKTAWVETYSKFDKVPYGNYLLFNEISSIFSKPTTTSFESLKTTLHDTLLHTNLIVINNNFEAEESEVNALLQFVDNGNNAMIISRNISSILLDTLSLKTDVDFNGDSETEISYLLAGDTSQFKGPTYNIYFRTYFDSLSNAQALGYRSDSLVNFISLEYGEGRLFFHVMPSVFTNAFILTKNNNEYISRALSYLPDQATIWDEYYKARKHYIRQTPFQQVLTTDGLRQALYLLLFGTLIYMVFASKRRQRAIPVLAPKANTTVDFVETMGKLYYNESDHKDIGMKRIKYFLADIRERHRIDTEVLDEEFSRKLSTLSGVEKEHIDKLATNFRVISTVEVVLDHRIVEQDKLIEKYYNKERSYGK